MQIHYFPNPDRALWKNKNDAKFHTDDHANSPEVLVLCLSVSFVLNMAYVWSKYGANRLLINVWNETSLTSNKNKTEVHMEPKGITAILHLSIE